jgi:anaerobic ribonucleoside-triphosphate reductase activating protein
LEYVPAEEVLLLHALHFPVYTLGPGTRVGLWFQGCRRRCPGCITPESWDFAPEKAIPLAEAVRRLRAFFEPSPRPDGLTISGGEPFDQPEALLGLLGSVRDLGVEDVLIYSGHRVQALSARYPQLPELAAALVDGPFEEGNLTDSVWKGSDNQSLTLWKEKFAPRYHAWTSGKKRRLQWVKSANGGLLVGIPRQEDVPRLKNPLC